MFKYFTGAIIKSRHVMINCKRKLSDRSKLLPYHRHIKYSKYRRVLINNLNMESIEARKILYNQQNIFNVPIDHIVAQFQLCERLHVDMTSLSKNVALLGWSAHTLDHRVQLLKDMGARHIHAAMVSNFFHMMSMDMGLFKAVMRIPENENVAKNLLNCVEPAPDGFPPLEELSCSLSVADHYRHCLRWYVEWKLQISKEDKQLMNRVVLSLKFRSFTLMTRLFDILHHEIGFTLEEIKKHGCMVSGKPDNLRKIIDNVKTFGGVDIKTIIKKTPKLHKISYNNVTVLMKELDKYAFTNQVIQNCPAILLIPKDALISRFQQLQSTPELRVLKNNSNALQLVSGFSKVQLRLNYLRYLNIKYVTVRSLTSNPEHFERYVRTGIDGTKGREMGYLLEKILRLEAKEVVRRIQKHPFWRHVDLVSIHETVTFLLERFSPEDLHDSLQLILYPREKIEETLNSLPELNQQSAKKEFTPSHILALILYEIEREVHFSGDGIWRHETPLTREEKSSSVPEHEVLSMFSDSEGTESDEFDELPIKQPFIDVNENVNMKS